MACGKKQIIPFATPVSVGQDSKYDWEINFRHLPLQLWEIRTSAVASFDSASVSNEQTLPRSLRGRIGMDWGETASWCHVQPWTKVALVHGLTTAGFNSGIPVLPCRKERVIISTRCMCLLYYRAVQRHLSPCRLHRCIFLFYSYFLAHFIPSLNSHFLGP